MKPVYFRQISEKFSNIMKIRPVGAELFHADGLKAGRHDEANSHFSQFCERTYK